MVYVGCGIYKPSQRCVRLYVGARTGRWRRDQGIRATSIRTHLFVSVVLVYGQRDQLSTETVFGGGFEG